MWIVVNIGCIESGVSSAIVGVFSSEAKATKIADKCQELFDWRECGQNNFEVFVLPTMLDVVAKEYAAATALSL